MRLAMALTERGLFAARCATTATEEVTALRRTEAVAAVVTASAAT